MKLHSNQVFIIAVGVFILVAQYLAPVRLSLNPLYPSVYVTQTGQGTVDLNGYTHSSAFAVDFNIGEQATLYATPEAGWTFTQWTVDGSAVTANPHSFTVNVNTSVNAVFTGGSTPPPPTNNDIFKILSENWLLILGALILLYGLTGGKL